MPTKTQSSSKSSGSGAKSRSSSKSSRSSSKTRNESVAEQVAGADFNEIRAAQAQAAAHERADAYDSEYKGGEVHGYAVFDHDARQLAQIFVNGDERQQKDDAAGYLGRLLGKTGEAAERNLSLVKVVEA